MSERLLVSPAEAGEMLGVGRSKTYQMIRDGELPAVRVGSRIRVPVVRLREWVERSAVTASST